MNTFTIFFKGEVSYDKTDVKAHGLAAMHIGCPDGVQKGT
jgi:hypothetical protein